jgi:hypothetical protein
MRLNYKVMFEIGNVITDGNYSVKIVDVRDDCYVVDSDEIQNDAYAVAWVIHFKNQHKWKLV